MGRSLNPRLYERIVATGQVWEEAGFTAFSPSIAHSPNPYIVVGGRRLLCFTSNNYLGLSTAPEVLAAASRAVATFGIGTCESRQLGGNLEILSELEAELATFKSKEAAVIFGTGLMANVGVIPALTHGAPHDAAGDAPVIIGDQLNHRSIVMGAKLSGRSYFRYRHNDMEHLETLLRENRHRPVLVVTDSVFSMDGDLAPLCDVCDLAERYGAMVMIDDAHGSGVLGRNGRGAAEHFGVGSRIHISMGTLSKAFGGMGGFIATERSLAEVIRMTASTYYFTSSLPAEQASGLLAAIRMVKDNSMRRRQLWLNTFRFHRGLRALGLCSPSGWSHIIPVLIPNAASAREIEQYFYHRGIYVCAVTFPAVPRDSARLRFSITAMHTDDDVDLALEILGSVAARFNFPREHADQIATAAPNYLMELADGSALGLGDG